MQAGLDIASRVFSSSDPQATYAALSADDLAAFASVEIPATSRFVPEEGPVATKAFSGCWYVTGQWDEDAIAGNTVFSYWQRTTVCVKKKKVTSITVTNYGSETSTPGWYRKSPETTAKYNASWEGRGLVRVYYALGVNGWDIQNLSPCGQLRLNADGSHYASSSSCNLN